MQNVVDNLLLRQFLLARVADADSQPPEIRRAQPRTDVLQAVVTGDTSPHFQLYIARLEVELIVDDKVSSGARGKPASADTACPLRFMNVIGFSSQQSCSILTASPKNFFSAASDFPSSGRARRREKRALWRVRW
jgi:hypothetical protein